MKIYMCILGAFTLSILGGRAQNILPVEKLVDYRNSETGIPESITYVKDVNGLLNKYVGTWKGTYQGKNYTFTVKKVTRQSRYRNLSVDELHIWYKITQASSGAVIADTNGRTDAYVIKGAYLAETKNYYVLDYFGLQGTCGQNGSIYISMNKDNNHMVFRLSPNGEIYPSCSQRAEQVLPTENITLTRH